MINVITTNDYHIKQIESVVAEQSSDRLCWSLVVEEQRRAVNDCPGFCGGSAEQGMIVLTSVVSAQ